MTAKISDAVPRDNPGTREIGFTIPETYNASRILFDNLAAGRGERLALTGPGGTRTYAELCAEASQWGHGFQSLGLKRGDRILMFLDDTPAYPAAFFGAVRSGFVPLLINTLTPPDLLQFYLSDAGAAVAVADAEFTSRFNAEACKDTPLHTLIVVNGTAGEHAVPKTLVAQQWLHGFSDRSSGSRHRVATTWRSGCIRPARPDAPRASCICSTTWPIASRPLRATCSGSGLTISASRCRKSSSLTALATPSPSRSRSGAATLLLPGQPKPAAIFEAIGKYRPSVFYGLPTLYTSLTKAEGAAATDFSSLRMALSAAEVLSAEVFNGWKALTGLEIIEGLGSTEVLHIYLSNRPEKKKLGAAGLRVPGYEILLRDKDGREVGDNEEGILWVRGDFNTPLYWNRPDKSAETIREGGWIYTGDRFLRDADGFHFFRGRADDLIKISGQWVYPLEVELCLAEHPDIRECAVFAAELPDRRMTLKAVVVMNKGGFDEDDATREAAGFREGKAAALQISARDPVHRRIAEDRYGQDRPAGVDADVARIA